MRAPTESDLRLCPDNVQEMYALLVAERDAQAKVLRIVSKTCEDYAVAVRVLGEELASWRSAPHRSDILETYWSDISDTDSAVIRWGLDVNNNPIAIKAVRDGE